MLTTEFTFLSAACPLAKTFTPTEILAYPLVKDVTSHSVNIDHNRDGLKKLTSVLQQQAEAHNCLLKGNLKRPIVAESRAGLTDQKPTTNWLVVDVDKIQLALLGLSHEPTLEEASEAVIAKLPEVFHNVSYIAHASSSFRMSSHELSVHLFFLLETPISTKIIKDYLLQINLSPAFKNTQRMSSTRMSICWTVDPSVADHSKLIYIANPILKDGVTDPYPHNRIVLVEKSLNTIDIREQLITVDSNLISKQKKRLLNAMRRAEGLDVLSDKRRNLTIRGQDVTVACDISAMEMEFYRESDNWVYYNINGGDSNAYYVWKDKPEVVYNFKGEAPFLFKQANPHMYAWHCHKFNVENPNPEVPFCFRDFNTDTHYNALYNPDTDRFKIIKPCSKQNIQAFMMQYGEILPDINNIKSYDYKFDPTTNKVVDEENLTINKFQAPPMLLSNESITTAESYDEWSSDCLEELCPTIYKILLSVTGDCFQSLKRFMNWLAFIIQERKKTKTAWIFSGTTGVGKGVLNDEILKRIFGQYSTTVTTSELEDKFNSGLEDNLITCVDEFTIKDAEKSNKLKNDLNKLITDERLKIRPMRADYIEIISFNSYIFFSNEYHIMQLHDNDRRYNVAPRQNVSLVHRYGPEIRDEIRTLVANEDGSNQIELFAKVLKGFPVYRRFVEEPMENEAKEQLRDYAKSSIDDFISALIRPDIRFFMTVLSYECKLVQEDFITPAQNHVKNMCMRLLDGQLEQKLLIREIIAFYRALVNPRESDQKISQILKKRGIETKPMRGDRGRARGLTLTFPAPSPEIIEEINLLTQPRELEVFTNPNPPTKPKECTDVNLRPERPQ